MIILFDLILFLLVIVGVMLVTMVLNKVMKNKGYKVSFTLNLFFISMLTIILTLFGGLTLWTLKGIILCYIFLYASTSDITNRKIDDYIWIMILILSLVNTHNLNIWSMLIGALVIFIITFSIAFFKEGSIGGADIKIATACGFMLGIRAGLIGFCLAQIFAVVYILVYNKIKKKNNKLAFPMLPFLSAGFLVSYFI